MRKKTRRISGMFLCLLMVAMAFAVAVPMNISADAKGAPFEGSFDGGNVPAVDPLERIVVSGRASYLGKYTAVVDANMAVYTIVGAVEVAPGVYFPILLLPTKATFTAANGDELYADMDLVGMRHMVDGNFPDFTLDATITGGTGRFEGFGGSFTGSGGQITMPGDDTDLVHGEFAGVISKEVPFTGNLDGNTVDNGNPALERIEMSGRASHLGKYTAVVEVDMTSLEIPIGFDPVRGLPIARLHLTATFTAANGDELYANIILVGSFNPSPLVQNFPYFELTATITGGTGRLNGATGSFFAIGGQTSVPGPDNDLITGTFVGMIS